MLNDNRYIEVDPAKFFAAVDKVAGCNFYTPAYEKLKAEAKEEFISRNWANSELSKLIALANDKRREFDEEQNRQITLSMRG